MSSTMIRLRPETKTQLEQLGETMLKLAKAGAPGIRVSNHAAGQYVTADEVVSHAAKALATELEADLENFHVSKPKRKGQADGKPA